LKKIPFIIIVYVFTTFNVAYASEGLQFAFVYLCKANDITAKTIELCITKFPQLSQRGNEALDSWRKRNASDALRGAQLCQKELEAQTLGVSQLAGVKERIEKLEAEYFESIDKKMQTEGIDVCNQFIMITEHKEGDLANILPLH
jgi:hypothetical protein